MMLYLPLLKVLVSFCSDPRFLILKVLSPPLSSSPILLKSLFHPLKVLSPLPPRIMKTAERHEAVPPFLVVGCSKMEHDSFTSCSSTVCSRTA